MWDCANDFYVECPPTQDYDAIDKRHNEEMTQLNETISDLRARNSDLLNKIVDLEKDGPTRRSSVLTG